MELTEKEKEIIKSLAKIPKTEYELFEKDKVASSSTVWKTTRKLMKMGLIEVKRQEKFQKIPSQIKKYYGLTFRGLVYSLKLGLKLSQIPNWKEIVSSWISNHRFPKVVGELRKKPEVDIASAQKELLNYIRLNQEQMEAFFRHYDLEFSDDLLICMELFNFVKSFKEGLELARQKRRMFNRLVEEIPEHYKDMFIIPQLWRTNVTLESDKA